MEFTFTTILLTLALFAAMLLCMEVGRRVGARRLASDPTGASAGVGAVDGAVFGLLGLLLAFSFSGAASRFDVRRQLIVEEANAIGTAYLRLALLAPEAQAPLRAAFQRYVDTRLEVYRELPDIAAARQAHARSVKLAKDIWDQAVAACRAEGNPPATMLLLPALNEMIDITTTRAAATRTHPPSVVFAMMFALALAAAMLAGYGMAASRTRNWLHVLGFAVSMAVAVYLVLDLEFPRLGLIDLRDFDQVLLEVRESMQ